MQFYGTKEGLYTVRMKDGKEGEFSLLLHFHPTHLSHP